MGASTNPIRVTSGSADAALPPGTYLVAEAGRTDAQTALWKPRESGIVCTRGDKNTNILGPCNTLTISEDDMSAIACTVDNTAAVVVVTAYNESTKTQLTTGGAVTMDLIPTTDTSAYISPGWADQPSTNSAGFLTANVDYRLSVPDGQSPGLVLVGVDEFTGTAYEDTDDVHSSEGNWTPLTESAFSIAGNTRKIIRGVFKNVDDVQKVSFAKAVKQPKTVAELGETREGSPAAGDFRLVLTGGTPQRTVVVAHNATTNLRDVVPGEYVLSEQVNTGGAGEATWQDTQFWGPVAGNYRCTAGASEQPEENRR